MAKKLPNYYRDIGISIGQFINTIDKILLWYRHNFSYIFNYPFSQVLAIG